MKSESSAASWLKFFTAAGISNDPAEHYAVTFSKNQIQLDMLPEINKEYLNDMGITLLGHVIAILRHAKTVYADEVKKSELSTSPKKQVVNASKEKSTSTSTSTLKSSKALPASKTSEEDEKPTTSSKRKSSVVLLNSNDGNEPKSKVRKNLCDSSDDIALPLVTKPSTTTLASDPSSDEMKKGVFRRLGSEVPQSSAETTSQISGTSESVFSRLGGKSCPPQVAKVAALPTTKRVLSNKEGVSAKPLVRKSIIRNRLDKPSRILVSPTYMDSILAEQKISSSVSNSLQEKRDVKARLGFSSAKSISALGTGNVKKVSFGSVFQKLIPRVKKPAFRSGSFNLIGAQRISIGATALNSPNLSTGVSSYGFNSKNLSIGSSSGVFSRLGI